MDVGAGEYTRQYFSSERYNIFEPSSRSHNVPIIDGTYQFVSAEAAASDVSYEKGRFSMDIVGAYHTDSVKSIRRTFEMDDDKVVMTDTYVADESASVVERFVTYTEPHVVGDGVIEIGECRFTYSGECELNINTENTSSGVCYLIDFTLLGKDKEIKIVME